MNSNFSSMIVFLLFFILTVILWPIIKWAILIFIVFLLVAYFYLRYRFKTALKKQQNQRTEYFNDSLKEKNEDVVDVTFREKDNIDD